MTNRVELVNHPYCNSGADQSLDRQTKICRPALWNEPIFIGNFPERMTIMTMRKTVTLKKLKQWNKIFFFQRTISAALFPLAQSRDPICR